MLLTHILKQFVEDRTIATISLFKYTRRPLNAAHVACSEYISYKHVYICKWSISLIATACEGLHQLQPNL